MNDQTSDGSAPLSSQLQPADREVGQRASHELVQFVTTPAQIELPLTFGRPVLRSTTLGHIAMALDAGASVRLTSFAQQAGYSLPVVAATAWTLVLGRLSSKQQVVLGVAESSCTGAEDIPALRTLDVALDDQVTLGELLERIGARWTAARSPDEPACAPGDPDTPPDLVLSIDDRQAPWELSLQYACDLLDENTASRWLGHLHTLLTRMPAHGLAARAMDLDMVGPDEAARMAAFNATKLPLAEGLVHGLVETQAARTPDGIAVVQGDAALTYRELDARANGLAGMLRARGVGPDAPVALYIERSIDMVVGLLAVLKAGGAYVPLDPSHPADRTAVILDGAAPRVVLTQTSLMAALPASSAETIALDTLEKLGDSDGSRAAQVPTLTPSHLAYVIYTSGSTGTPKGVAMPHRGLVNLLQWQRDNPARGHAQRTLQFAALGFDVAFQEIFSTLSTGGTLVLIHESVRRDPQALAAVMREQRVQRLFLPFIALQNLAEYIVAANEALPDLQDVMTAGEQLHASPAVRTLFQRLPDCRLHNQYGPTETHVVTALTLPDDPATWAALPSIGRPIANNRIHVLDARGRVAPLGVAGEIHIGGVGVARGYLNRPELSAERFVPDPFSTDPDARLYKTGDIGRWREDGEIDYLGRNDHQVKVRGFRVELGEIESALLRHPAVREAAVLARHDGGGDARLVAYVTTGTPPPPAEALRAHLEALLPPYMLPSTFVHLAAMPLSPNGKVDRRALPEPVARRPEMPEPYEEGRNESERLVCAAFAEALGIDRAGRADNFFDLGGDSLRVLKVLAQLQATTTRRLSTNLFFQDPTPQAIARELDGRVPAAQTPAAGTRPEKARADEEPIAIIAMAGRFPGAADVEQFWANLCEGRDSVTFFDDHTLDAGVGDALRSDPSYVRARGVIEGVEDFDPSFFGINPKEAMLMDPQQRIFLEICWECMERGGYAPDQQARRVGVYAGMHNATYFQKHVMPRPDLIDTVGEFTVMLGNEKDYIATRVAHRLNLTGPAISMNTACSTSLVAMAQAFHALRSGQCDMALAGGVAITCPPRSGYVHQEGAMLSPDGHTRSFDAKAQGTVFSDGAGVVLLKRLSDARADGDPIYAVLRGVALNNDGGTKASFTAPSVDGQAAVVSAALASAGVDARSISYVEAHGTATPMGDPVEVAALSRSFSQHSADLGYCAIGSVKSNVGHLLMAAGAAGVIKTALALHDQRLPASLHFDAANPAIDFANTAFHVNDRLSPWPRREGAPRRAGVSSFGVGGTNAHVILEEAPLAPPSEAAAGPQVLTLSARTPTALAMALARLADHLEAAPELNLGDVAYTLQVGRKAFANRAAVVADSVADAIAALRTEGSPRMRKSAVASRAHDLVLLFPGQGSQYAGMGRTMYVHDETFRMALDECFDAFDGELPFALRDRLFSDDADGLKPTSVTQPAIFALEYALARRTLALGLTPAAMIGHSAGEFAAAVIAGVMPLRSAARLVAQRGALMQELPAGSMLSVRLSAAALAPYLDDEVSLAGDNGPSACVAAGPAERIADLQRRLEGDGVAARLLQTSHAFHSAMMDAAVEPFESLVREVALAAPKLPIISTLSGQILSDAEAVDPAYWARHLRHTVRFSPAVRTAMSRFAQPLFVELGPRNTLATLVRQHASREQPAPAVAVLAAAPADELVAWRLAIGQLWTVGAPVDVGSVDTRTRKLRVRLPTYPFERKRCWVDVTPQAQRDVSPSRSVAADAPAPQSSSLSPIVPKSEPSMPLAPSPIGSRSAALNAKVRELFEDISGNDMADTDGATPFVDQGLDSLVLTQAAIQLKKHFNINITFRQLMEGCRSFDLLADHLDKTLPPEPVADAAPVALPATSPAPAAYAAPTAGTAMMPAGPAALAQFAGPAEQNAMHQLIAQQMQLMQQQLALLGGATMPPAAAQARTATPAGAAASAVAATPIETTPAVENEASVTYDVKKAFGAIARIHTVSRELSGRQRARLDAFVRRYVERTQKSKEFTAKNRAHMADPRVVNGFRPATKEITYQIVVDRSKGSRLWDIDGNEYVDTLNGFGMNLFGWQPDFINDAIRRQLDLGYEIGPQHPLAAEVTERICELTGFDRAALCNTGSESVMAAIRIARTATGRSTVVVFTGSYHGTFDEVLVRAGRNHKGMSAAPGVMQGMFGDIRVLDYGSPESLEYIRANADELAAVLVEPVQSRRPDFQPREFLHELRAITQKSETCLIFDEVITGFRSHLGGAQALFGIRADLACYGKVIGGGLPVGVIAGKRAFMDALDGGTWQYADASVPTVGVTYFAGTFVRHPLALAAAKAALDHLKQDNNKLQTQLNLHTAAMADELSSFCREVGAPLEIRYFASLWRVSWLEDHPLQDLLFAMMRSRGVHILDNFPCFMTTAHTQQDIATIKSAFKESVAELQEADFLPRHALTASAFDAAHPPVPNARLGRDKDGQPAWFVPDPSASGKFVKVNV